MKNPIIFVNNSFATYMDSLTQIDGLHVGKHKKEVCYSTLFI